MVELGWLTAPQSHLQWGAATIGLGFALLAGALVTSWRLRSGRPPRPPIAFEVDPPPL